MVTWLGDLVHFSCCLKMKASRLRWPGAARAQPWCLLGIAYPSLLMMRFFNATVTNKAQSSRFELEMVDLTWLVPHYSKYALLMKAHRNQIPFLSLVCFGPHLASYLVVIFIPCLLFYSWYFACMESFRKLLSPFGRPFRQTGFQQMHNTIA